jgi:hypothetical protein
VAGSAEGLALFLARYQPAHAESAITPILLGLGYLDDVADDRFLPIERDTIARYWQKRQPAIITAIERHGITAPLTPDLPLPSDREPRPHPRDANEATHTNSNGDRPPVSPGVVAQTPRSPTPPELTARERKQSMMEFPYFQVLCRGEFEARQSERRSE